MRVFGAVVFFVLAASGEEFRFARVSRDVIEDRLHRAPDKNSGRQAALKTLFAEAGCTESMLSEQKVRGTREPNVLCSSPGETASTIVAGAHFDFADAGKGVVDNWSGASLLASLLQGLRTAPRRHTFVFIGFAGEEKGLLGSRSYVKHLSAEDKSRIRAMVNMDTLGLTPTKVWVNGSDKMLTSLLAAVAQGMKAPLGVVNVERTATADSQSFAEKKIPAITIHSVTQETFRILHSPRDTAAAINMDDYFETYQLLAAYLTYLDTALD